MTKTFTYASGTVTVHGVENWPKERFVPILTSYLEAVLREEGEEDAA
jgi:hypothetical protein